jgi:hypothetical protein
MDWLDKSIAMYTTNLVSSFVIEEIQLNRNARLRGTNEPPTCTNWDKDIVHGEWL